MNKNLYLIKRFKIVHLASLEKDTYFRYKKEWYLKKNDTTSQTIETGKHWLMGGWLKVGIEYV